jgi:hypothetical protein
VLRDGGGETREGEDNGSGEHLNYRVGDLCVEWYMAIVVSSKIVEQVVREVWQPGVSAIVDLTKTPAGSSLCQ